MKIKEYFAQLNARSQAIFDNTLAEPQVLSASHSLAADLNQLADCLIDSGESGMLRTASAQVELSCLALAVGLYRPAFGSLRLALELGVGSFYFSAHKLAHREWQSNSDLKWAVIAIEEGGVFSDRFVRAFYPDLTAYRAEMCEQASSVYRRLSEFVHGNRETWTASGLALQDKPDLRQLYGELLEVLGRLLKFAYCVRHLNDTNAIDRERLEPILADLQHIAPIRELLGGPKEIK